MINEENDNMGSQEKELDPTGKNDGRADRILLGEQPLDQSGENF